jgi:hypothetical protein
MLAHKSAVNLYHTSTVEYHSCCNFREGDAMSKISTSHSPEIALFVVCVLLGITQADDKLVPGSLTHYRFNGNAKDANNRNPDFELQNTEFKDNALFLNGIYELSAEQPGYRAICKTSGLDIERFTVALRFKSEPFRLTSGEIKPFPTNLFTGGVDKYRWFGLERSQRGNLEIMLNNSLFHKEIKGAVLNHKKWNVVACSVDIPARKVITAVNGKPSGVIELPNDFKYFDLPNEVGGVELPKEIYATRDRLKIQLMNKDTEKEWSFANYSNGSCFHGLVDELLIFGRALTAEELERIPLRP